MNFQKMHQAFSVHVVIHLDKSLQLKILFLLRFLQTFRKSIKHLNYLKLHLDTEIQIT